MKIKKYYQYINEISGTELVGPIGPAFGEVRQQNKTVTAHDTTVILSQIDDKLYTIDQYNDMYNEYLKLGGSPLMGDFCIEHLDMVIDFLNKASYKP